MKRQQIKAVFANMTPTQRTALWGALEVAFENPDYSPLEHMTGEVFKEIHDMREVLQELGANRGAAGEDGWR